MTSFYKNKGIVVAKVIGAGYLLIVFAIASIKIGDLIFTSLGIILISTLLFIIYIGLSRPAIIVSDHKILINTFFGKTREVDDLSNYKLVLSNDFLAFRRSGQNDIMIDKGWYKNKQWQDLVIFLKSLSFQEVIE